MIIDLILHQNKVDEGFRLLVKKYNERVYWLVRRMLLNHDDSNDVTQEIFIKIFKNLHQFQGDSGLFTWIYRISTNECLTFLRKRKNGKLELTDPFQIPESTGGTIYFNGDEAMEVLWEAISSLPEKQKVVFNLRYFDELSYAELSKILTTSEGALKASYHHAVKKIENYIHEKGT